MAPRELQTTMEATDIFISYAAKDREFTQILANSLEEIGWIIWWDRSIKFGEPFDRIIERNIKQANAVIVVWSSYSIESDWVRAEASYALSQQKLVPIMIEIVDPPLRFMQIQTANMVG